MIPFLEDNILDRQWSWAYGLGGDIFSEFSYYYTTSPFFYLQLFLKKILGFEILNYDTIMIWKIIINIIRQALSMIFMYFLLLYEKEKKNYFALIGAVCYGTSNLFFSISLRFDFMNDCFVWLPMTFLAFRYYEREKKILPFVAAIAITIANNFYFAFINCVAYGVYFLWFSYDKGISIKQYFIKIIKIVLICVLGLCIASVFFLPSVRTFMMLDRTAAIGNLSIIPETKILYNFYQNFISLNSNLTIPLFIILIIYSLKGIDKNSLFFRKLIFMAFWVVMMMIPFFNSMMNGFSYNSNRWNYIIVFAAAYFIPDLLEEVCEKKKLGFIKMIVLYIISIILLVIYRIGGGAEVFTKQEVINLAVNLYMIRIIGQYSRVTKKVKRTFRGYFIVVLLFVLSMIRIYSYQPPSLSDDASKKRIEDLLFGDDTTKYVIKELNQNPYAFFRVSDETSTSYYDNNYGRYENMSLNNGIYGVTTYNSMMNGDLSNWLKRAYNIRGLFTSPSYYRGFDNRYFLETAWGVKYKVNYNSEKYPDIPLGYSISPINIENKYRNVLVNNYDVGIDLWYDSAIDTSDLDQMDFAYKDAYILQTAAVDNIKNDYAKAKIDNVTSKIDIGNIDEWVYQNCEYVNGKIVVKEKNSAKIIIPINNEDINGEYLFSFDIDESYDKTFKFKVNGREVQKYYSRYQWRYPLECFSVKLDGNADSIIISLPDVGEYSIFDARLYFNSYDKLGRWIERLNKYNLENLNIGDDYIFGILNNKEKGILALSIPYNDGWKCFVDGEETDILKVNGIFSGIELAPGEHNIEFEFYVPLFREGLMISLLGMVICVGVVFYQRQKKRMNYREK